MPKGKIRVNVALKKVDLALILTHLSKTERAYTLRSMAATVEEAVRIAGIYCEAKGTQRPRSTAAAQKILDRFDFRIPRERPDEPIDEIMMDLLERAREEKNEQTEI